MNPGVAVPEIIGDPVTKEEVAKEVGAERPFYLLRANIREAAEKIGYTKNCKGCRAVELGYSSRPMHTPECRLRMEAEIKKTVRGQQRMQAFEQRLASDVEARVRRAEVEEEVNKGSKVQATGSTDRDVAFNSGGSSVIGSSGGEKSAGTTTVTITNTDTTPTTPQIAPPTSTAPCEYYRKF